MCMLDVEIDSVSDAKKEDIKVSLSPILSEIKDSYDGNNSEGLRRVRELFVEEPQAIRIFAAGSTSVIQAGGTTWRSPSFRESDNNGLSSGGVYRVAAGGILMQSFSKSASIVGGRYVDNIQPPPSYVMKEELRMMGIDEDRIISDPDTTDTIAELIRLIEISEINGWTNVVCTTNRYHIDRVKTLLDNLDWLAFNEEKTKEFLQGYMRVKSGELKIGVIPSEDVIQAYDEEMYERHIANTQVSSERIDAEKRGVALLGSGLYGRFNSRTNRRTTMHRASI